MTSRRKQIESLQNESSVLASKICDLKDELETALENLPENLQDSAQAEKMQNRIDTLDDIYAALTDFTEFTDE